MTSDLTGTVPARGADPMKVLQRRAFGFGGYSAAIQLGIAVLGPIAALPLCWGRAGGLVIAAAVLIPTPVVLGLLSLRGRSKWAAQDVLGWLDGEAAARWREGTGTPMPRNSAQAAAWLQGRDESVVPADYWVAALLMAGRVEDATERIGKLPAETPAQRRRRSDLRLAADAAAGRRADYEAADEAVVADPAADPVARAVHLAYHGAVSATSNGADGLPLLAGARPAIGRLPLPHALRLYAIRFRYAAISVLFGSWLLAAVLVGLATSGGVVWF